ncbi:MAG: uroporphyrinogen-III C-methyltransferase [Desulfurococcales archaeon]|nr:uroporphyrinogen-III C-methyltransferase [Desulfurococcales archaeon]
MKGKVVLVGAGPGDPGLITVKGLREVRRAHVIVYDRLVPRELLKEARPDAELVYAGKEPGMHHMDQEEINRLLLDRALGGMHVVRLKGGDPLVFGRGEEECLYLAARGVRCEIVPGIPSYIYASTRSLAPLGSRLGSHSYTVTTGILAGGKPNPAVTRLLAASDTLVLLMAAGRAKEVLGTASKVLGPNTLGVVVYRGAMPGEKVIYGTVEELAQSHARGEYGNPSVIILGGAAKVARRLQAALHGPR